MQLASVLTVIISLSLPSSSPFPHKSLYALHFIRKLVFLILSYDTCVILPAKWTVRIRKVRIPEIRIGITFNDNSYLVLTTEQAIQCIVTHYRAELDRLQKYLGKRLQSSYF